MILFKISPMYSFFVVVLSLAKLSTELFTLRFSFFACFLLPLKAWFAVSFLVELMMETGASGKSGNGGCWGMPQFPFLTSYPDVQPVLCGLPSVYTTSPKHFCRGWHKPSFVWSFGQFPNLHFTPPWSSCFSPQPFPTLSCVFSYLSRENTIDFVSFHFPNQCVQPKYNVSHICDF